eukprot:2885878-Amphidinium_carterae.1
MTDPVAHIVLPRIVAATESGDSVDAEQKAWIHSSGCVLWELRRFCIAFLARRKTLNLSQYLRDNRSNLSVWFERAGAGNALQESQQSLKDRGGAMQCHNHAEFSIASHGILALLIGSSLGRRVAAEQQLCFHLLVGLFRAVNPEQ